MGTTPNYGLPYPNETDDADVPLDMQELADTLDGIMLGRTLVDAKGDLLAASGADTVARVPAGTDGQVLSADGASAAGLKWIPLAGAYVPVSSKGQANGVASLDASAKVPVAQLPANLGGGAIPPTIVDAKGDLIAASAPDTVARLGVGADGQALIADAASALGLKWGTVAGGGGGGGPGEISYVEFTAPVTVSATTEAAPTIVIQTPSLSFDGSPVLVEFFSPVAVLANVTAAPLNLNLWMDGADQGRVFQVISAIANDQVVPVVRRRFTPPAGTHTLSIRGWVNAGTTATIYGGVGASGGVYVPAFLRISRADAGGVSVGVGTTLPASPFDGQEFVLVDSLTAPNYAWRFRYTASITADAYKWVFVGGAPYITQVVAQEGLGATVSTWVDPATVGPRFVVPRAGHWDVIAGAQGSHAAANTLLQLGVFRMPALSGTMQHALTIASAGAYADATVSEQHAGLAAGDELRVRYWQNVANALFANRWLRVVPWRVS